MTAARPLILKWCGRSVVVRKNDRHPEHMLWIDVGERTYFLGVLVPGMRRGDVRKMAVAWLEAHPEHTRA